MTEQMLSSQRRQDIRLLLAQLDETHKKVIELVATRTEQTSKIDELRAACDHDWPPFVIDDEVRRAVTGVKKITRSHSGPRLAAPRECRICFATELFNPTSWCLRCDGTKFSPKQQLDWLFSQAACDQAGVYDSPFGVKCLSCRLYVAWWEYDC